MKATCSLVEVLKQHFKRISMLKIKTDQSSSQTLSCAGITGASILAMSMGGLGPQAEPATVQGGSILRSLDSHSSSRTTEIGRQGPQHSVLGVPISLARRSECQGAHTSRTGGACPMSSLIETDREALYMRATFSLQGPELSTQKALDPSPDSLEAPVRN